MYSQNNEKAKIGESYVYSKLLEIDPRCQWSALGRRTPEDFLLSNGKKIDVKVSHPNNSKNQIWHFNMHHHNKRQDGIDYFICVAYDGESSNTYIFPSKLIRKSTLAITRKQMARGKFDFFKDNWDIIKNDF